MNIPALFFVLMSFVFAAVKSSGNALSITTAVLAADILISVPFSLFRAGVFKLAADENTFKLFKGIFISAAVIVLAEVFICNFGAFSLASPSAPPYGEFDISAVETSGGENSDGCLKIKGGDTATISIKNIGSEVRTLYIDASVSGIVSQRFDIRHTDETTAEPRQVSALNYIHNDENSKYVTLSWFGEVGEISISAQAPEGGEVTVNGIAVNKTIPFNFSLIRIVLVFAAVMFVLVCKYGRSSIAACGGSGYFSMSAFWITVVFLIIAAALTMIHTDSFGLLRDPDTNQMNKELVDAFRAGQVSLLEKPSSEMLALNNPYDWSERIAAGVSYPWDHLLFEGKYYSYYGIASVLTLFLPYNLITGSYFSSLWATLLYGAIGIIFLSLTYCEFVKRLFPQTPNSIAVSGLIITQASSFVWYCFTIGNFYELAQVSGFAFLTVGAYFMFRSNVFGSGRVSRLNICLSTIFLSLAVLARAALALYCICALLFIFAGVRKIVKTAEVKTYKANIRSIITFLLAALIPFAVIGSVQMIYNYLRFGSILDFGIQYTMTIYDYQHIQFHVPLALIAIYNYMFTLPKLTTQFPFVQSNYDSLNVNGFYFLANFSSAGLIFRAFPVTAYLFSRKAYRLAGRNKLNTLIIFLTCIVVPFIQMAMIWEYGYCPRYAVDFAWQMLFGAFVILFIIYTRTSSTTRRMLRTGFVVSAIAAVIVNFALIYEWVMDYANTLDGVSLNIRAALMSFGRLFEFWNIF